VLKFAGARWGAVDDKNLSGVEKSAFANILDKAAWSRT